MLKRKTVLKMRELFRRRQLAPFRFELKPKKTVKKAPRQSHQLKQKKVVTKILERDDADTNGEEDVDLKILERASFLLYFIKKVHMKLYVTSRRFAHH